MSRVLRGAWSRRGPLTALVLMTFVVVAGAVTVLRFAQAAGTSRALTAPLLLLGAVAVPSLGAELAVARREEVGLARLRGIRGLRLWRFLLLEPLLAIVLGTVAGLAAGALLTVLVTAAWLDEAAPPGGRTALLAALAIAGGALVIVALGAAAGLREPLAAQVATRHRPRRATTLAVFGAVLVIVGAGVAAYRSRQTGPDAAAGPDLVVLLGPALVGLALGQVAVWVVRLAARVGTGATAAGGLGGFLAARRLARADDLVTPLRLVVAAAVVGCLALTGSVAVDRWTDGQSRVATAGPRVIDVADGAISAYRLTRELDPDGRHLMTTVLVPNEKRLPERRAYVDAVRWDAVVGDLYDGTAAAPGAAAVDRLVPGDGELAVVPGERLQVSARALVMEEPGFITLDGDRYRTGSRGLVLTLSFVQADDGAGSVSVPLRLRGQGSRATRTVDVPGCAEGCLVTAISVERRLVSRFLGFDDSDFEVLIGDLRLGDVDLLDQPWVPDAGAVEASAESVPRLDATGSFVVNRPDGLQVRLLPDRALPLRGESAGQPLAVLAAGDAPAEALDLGGDERPRVLAGEAALLPLVGTAGVLADLPSAARGSGPTVPSAQVRIVAGEAAPASLLADVEQATGSSWRPLDDVRRDLGAAHGGAQATAYALTALACALVALLALVAGVARHVREYRRDVAALRVVGVGLGTARRAGRTELAALTVLVVTAVALGGWLAVRLLLGGLPLVDPPVAAPAVDTSPALWPLLAPAALAAVVVLVVGGRARAVRAGTTRPSLLREEEGA